jgi:hypothetical protein
MLKEPCANHLELFLKFGEPSAKDENFLRAVVVVLNLLAPIIILLSRMVRAVPER